MPSFECVKENTHLQTCTFDIPREIIAVIVISDAEIIHLLFLQRSEFLLLKGAGGEQLLVLCFGEAIQNVLRTTGLSEIHSHIRGLSFYKMHFADLAHS